MCVCVCAGLGSPLQTSELQLQSDLKHQPISEGFNMSTCDCMCVCVRVCVHVCVEYSVLCV